MCLFWSTELAHIDRWKLFDCGESLRRREKQNQVSLGTLYSILNSPWITRKSKLCYFRKMLICSVTNSSKTRHSKDLSCASQRPFRTSWTSKRSCLSSSESRYMREGIYPNYITFTFQKVECSHETHDHAVVIVSKNSRRQLESCFNSYP